MTHRTPLCDVRCSIKVLGGSLYTVDGIHVEKMREYMNIGTATTCAANKGPKTALLGSGSAPVNTSLYRGELTCQELT